METYDVIIVGAGPAGATLARLIGCKYKVLLLDRRPLDRPWRHEFARKCCGGLLAPDAQKALAGLKLSLPEKTLGGPQLFAVRSIDLGSGDERHYQRFYLNLDRENFDRWTVELARPRVDVAFGAIFHACRDNTVYFHLAGTSHAVRFRYLVAADGAAGRVRRSLCGDESNPGDGGYVAIQESLELIDSPPFFSAFFDSGLTDFYDWTIPKRDELLLGAALAIDGDVKAKFFRLKEKLVGYGMRFGARRRLEGALLRRPRRLGELWLGRENVFAIGEAAGLISPSSAEGFSFAFRSAEALSHIFLDNREPELAAYRSATAAVRRDLYGKILKIPFMYQPLLRRAIMRSGLTALR